MDEKKLTMNRSELMKLSGYWTQHIQISLFNAVNDYLKKNKITRSAFAEQLGVSKGYISQVLNGDFDHKLSKLVELSLACGCVPSVSFEPMEKAGEVAAGYTEAPAGPAPFFQSRMYTSGKKSLSAAQYVAPQIKFTPVKIA